MYKNSRKIIFVMLFLLVICLTPTYVGLSKQKTKVPAPQLLSDPFLQQPTKNSIRVVWFTEFPGSKHIVTWGRDFTQTAFATTTKLSRTREDQKSQVGVQNASIPNNKPVKRDIWRHEAVVTGLKPGTRVNYRVTSIRKNGLSVSSKNFTLTPNPLPNTPLKILLTSDHQLKPMVAANMQKVVETVGRVDGVFFAGDAASASDRASGWFDDSSGGAFFPCLQGRARKELEHDGVKITYRGGEIIQHAPIFTTIGNSDVMGRFSWGNSLNDEYQSAIPRQEAQKLYGKKNLKNNSFNTDTYEEIFSLPRSKSGGETYYAVTFGNVRLVSLYITNVWRVPDLGKPRGKYQESPTDLNNPQNWGYGQFIFEPITPGSTQYRWLQQELNSPEFKRAKYKVVMFHHPPHSLGDNVVPAYTDPVQVIERDKGGKITAVRYKYPQNLDYLTRDVIPLLEKANVQLVLYGHSHLWNRFRSRSGMNFLETSNVGNSYGAFWDDKKRQVPTGDKQDFFQQGNPNGLEPVVPNISPLKNAEGKPLPYIASNDITVFSILDTGTGTVSSYRFDTSTQEPVVKFDEFNF
ncbi:MAG: metallophosphoesterase [Calothrix sp. C42_A2020_038]|nr:metallophosphoesterase [Calothrix sp. C42_A2020_038]